MLKADYRDTTGKFWRDSYIKNIIVTQSEGETIHDTIKRVVLNNDGLELAYNGEPQANIYRDIKGESKIIGYIYRAKDEIDGKRVMFDLWVEVREVVYLELKDIEAK